MKGGPVIDDDASWPPRLDGEGMRLLAGAELRFRRERLRLYRVYLRLMVKRTSPLLVDVAEEWGLDVASALVGMRPPPGWPYSWNGIRSAARAMRNKGTNSSRHCPARWGKLPRAASGQTSSLRMLSVERDVLQPQIRIGKAVCYGVDGGIEVWLPGPIPETIAIALPGRSLASVVHHTLFERRPYKIVGALPDVGGSSIIVVDAPAVMLPVCWTEGL